MHIRVVNPNTTAAMTALIGASARAVAGPGVRVEAVTSAMGPASIESHYDEALSVPGLLAAIADGETRGIDGYVIACFGDPGLDAARELARGPVVGIAEAAMHTAALLGRGFSVVTTLDRTGGRAWDLAARYTAPGACRGVHACEIPVLELEADPHLADRVAALAGLALERDGSDVIVLGCAGMAGLCAAVSDRLGVPVVDGVSAATLMVQSLVALGLRTSQRREFAAPPPKRYTGAMATFQLESANRPVSRGSSAM
ncbi:aspartate/glutamate racemase family protein [Dactylosporangium matsuzakiense]|uniref:Hydantoin racemase n=2 Tax=Dactylosporangium matsuzakiense TaxID=53360 RepID=A0A9W6KGN5_9ACTN|nr:aspartate/glutamate racemase family protein [Dactylosporangium matsuzakiense]UWZ42534.1 aspartate/glutamate racemase family protein [Dactylosporangium matsuzakiense]GLL00547.1 Asp/Glu racemase [Dactylosporangium matsuzakiense]